MRIKLSEEFMDEPVAELMRFGLSHRTMNALGEMGIIRVGQMRWLIPQDITRCPSLGRMGLYEIKSALAGLLREHRKREKMGSKENQVMYGFLCESCGDVVDGKKASSPRECESCQRMRRLREIRGREMFSNPAGDT